MSEQEYIDSTVPVNAAEYTTPEGVVVPVWQYGGGNYDYGMFGKDGVKRNARRTLRPVLRSQIILASVIMAVAFLIAVILRGGSDIGAVFLIAVMGWLALSVLLLATHRATTEEAYIKSHFID